jgi:ribosomal protein L5
VPQEPDKVITNILATKSKHDGQHLKQTYTQFPRITTFQSRLLWAQKQARANIEVFKMESCKRRPSAHVNVGHEPHPATSQIQPTLPN